jgi:hypothetical protein
LQMLTLKRTLLFVRQPILEWLKFRNEVSSDYIWNYFQMHF